MPPELEDIEGQLDAAPEPEPEAKPEPERKKIGRPKKEEIAHLPTAAEASRFSRDMGYFWGFVDDTLSLFSKDLALTPDEKTALVEVWGMLCAKHPRLAFYLLWPLIEGRVITLTAKIYGLKVWKLWKADRGTDRSSPPLDGK